MSVSVETPEEETFADLITRLKKQRWMKEKELNDVVFFQKNVGVSGVQASVILLTVSLIGGIVGGVLGAIGVLFWIYESGTQRIALRQLDGEYIAEVQAGGFIIRVHDKKELASFMMYVYGGLRIGYVIAILIAVASIFINFLLVRSTIY